MVEIKFCGLTRPEDAAQVAALGAQYAGVIFAGGPRERTPAQAREVLAPLDGSGVRRVGVFAAQSVDEIVATATVAQLDIVQLTYGAERTRRIGLRTSFRGEIWAVAHLRPADRAADASLAEWFEDGVDAIVLDAAVPGQLGGTGVALDWAALAPTVARLRQAGRVVLAGGLRPTNVGHALSQVAVDIVDVSSGVESAPGVKDPEQMRAFAAAVRAVEVR